MNTFEGVLPCLAVFTTENSSLLVFPWPSQAPPSTRTPSENGSALCFLGRGGLPRCGFLGEGVWGYRYQTRDEVKSQHTRFYNREIQLGEGRGSRSRLKK